MNARFTAILIGLAAFANITFADSPLPAPERSIVKSPDGVITAVSDPSLRTTVFQNTATKKILWELPSWERSLFVANDGKHAVTGHDGLNLIPQSYDEGMVLFTFWREGKKIRQVTLKEFIANKSKPERTVSHYHWGYIQKIDADGNLVVSDAQTKLFRYDIRTGLEIK